MTFFGWRPFLLEITCFRPEKPLEFPISAAKSLAISVKTFFFWRSPDLGRKNRLNSRFRPENPLQFQWRLFLKEITWFGPEKPLEFPISAEKSLWNFAPHLVHLIQIWINFSCPHALLEFTQTSRAPPKFISAPPPVTLSWSRACLTSTLFQAWSGATLSC